jgi:hypothetical protein
MNEVAATEDQIVALDEPPFRDRQENNDVGRREWKESGLLRRVTGLPAA